MAKDAAQWYGACLTSTRPWVQSAVSKKKIRMTPIFCLSKWRKKWPITNTGKVLMEKERDKKWKVQMWILQFYFQLDILDS
jgi:hypothetical protein